MQFVIPENIGSDLRVIPADAYHAKVQDIYLGTSSTGNPKATVKYAVTSEYTGQKDKDFESTIGATVLETFSLLPQALFNINGMYKSVMGANIPQGEYDEEGLLGILKEALIGQEFILNLSIGTSQNTGEDMNNVDDRKAVKGKGPGAAAKGPSRPGSRRK